MTDLNSISVMTWNIWFDSFEYIKRMESIISIILSNQPDIVCLQEVVPDFDYILNSSSYSNNILQHYNCSPFSNVNAGYGVITLSKKSITVNHEFINLPSSMNRQLLITSFQINGCWFAVGNVHLESLHNHKTRELQMQVANKELLKYSSAILVGDFNFCSERNYNINTTPLENNSLASCLPGYIDIWSHLHPHVNNSTASFSTPTKQSNSLGFTFNTLANNMLTCRGNRPHEIMRYDRIMLKVNTTSNDDYGDSTQARYSLSPSNIKLVGDTAVDSETYNRNGVQFIGLFASDHFGLLAIFDVIEVNHKQKRKVASNDTSISFQQHSEVVLKNRRVFNDSNVSAPTNPITTSNHSNDINNVYQNKTKISKLNKSFMHWLDKQIVTHPLSNWKDGLKVLVL
jgi:endonuclease/exonuclease/phosphatase family metal-dependent hydrolase